MAVPLSTTRQWLAAREGDRAARADAQVEAMRARLPGAVRLLRERFQVGRAWLFGSYATGGVHEGSDVDLLVEGLVPADVFPAVGEVMGLLGAMVHLVRVEDAPASLLDRVRAEGVEL